MLRSFQVHSPESVQEAVDLRRRLGDEAMPYAGGTELLLIMKLGLAHWAHLIDMKRIEELKRLDVAEGRLLVGAAVTHYELERSTKIRSCLPAFSDLEAQVANIRVRVAGTLAGNLAFAEPHADPPALLVALGATIALAGPGGVRKMLVEEFLVGPYQTALGQEEIITAIELPIPEVGVRCAYLNFRISERPSVCVAVVARLEDGCLAGEPVVVVGAATPTPRRAPVTGLAGLRPGSKEAQQAVAEIARSVADPGADLSGSKEYKRHLVGVVAARALASLDSAA